MPPTPLRPHRLRAATGVAAAGLLFATSLAAQPAGLRVTRLTPPGQAFSDHDPAAGRSPEISADGRWIAYWFDGDTDDVHDLYVAFRFGGAPRRVSALRPAGALTPSSLHFGLSADSRHLVMMIDQETVGRIELWSVPIDGTAADGVKISGALEPDESVSAFTLSPDGGDVVFATRLGDDYRVYHVPIDGGAAPARIDPPGVTDDFGGFQRSGPQVFWTDGSSGAVELWRAPLDGSATASRVNGDLAPGGQVASYRFSPDATRVVYRADARFDGVVELWSVPANGPTSAAVRLSPTLPAAGDVHSSFSVHADPQRVLFRADTAIDEQLELWSVPLAGPATAAAHLNVALVAGGDVAAGADAFEDRVIYLADNAVDGQTQAFVVPIDGPFTSSVPLHAALGPSQLVGTAGFVPRAGDPLALMVGNLRDETKVEIYVQDPESPGEPYSLFDELPVGVGFRSSCGAGSTPDLESLVVCADLDVADKVELYRVGLDFGTAPEKLSSIITVAGADVTRVVVSTDGVWAVYRTDASADERYDLHRVRVDGVGAPQRIHAAPPSAARDVDETLFLFTPEGAGIVYAADHENDEQVDLWISDAAIFFDGFELGDSGTWSDAAP